MCPEGAGRGILGRNLPGKSLAVCDGLQGPLLIRCLDINCMYLDAFPPAICAVDTELIRVIVRACAGCIYKALCLLAICTLYDIYECACVSTACTLQ